MKITESFTLGVSGQLAVMRFMQGRPTAVTFQVFRDTTDDNGPPEFSGTATIDTVNTTTSAASGAASVDRRAVTLASSAGVVEGRKYLLGGREWIEPVRLGAPILTRHPITGVYATSSAFVSTYASALIDATWSALTNNLSDLGNPWPDYRIRWSATINGATIVDYSYFDVVRVKADYGIDIDTVNLRIPGLRDSMPAAYSDDNGAMLLRSSWFSLQASLNAIGITADSVRDAQFLDEAMILKTMTVLAQGGWSPLGVEWQAFYDATREAFNVFISQHLQSTQRHALSSGSGNASIAKSGTPVWGK